MVLYFSFFYLTFQCKTPPYPVCVAALKSTGLDYVKDKIECGTNFTKDCLGVPEERIKACKVIIIFILISNSYKRQKSCILYKFQHDVVPQSDLRVYSRQPLFLIHGSTEIPGWGRGSDKEYTDQNHAIPNSNILEHFFLQSGTDKCLVAGTSIADAEACVTKEFPTFIKCTQVSFY